MRVQRTTTAPAAGSTETALTAIVQATAIAQATEDLAQPISISATSKAYQQAQATTTALAGHYCSEGCNGRRSRYISGRAGVCKHHKDDPSALNIRPPCSSSKSSLVAAPPVSVCASF